MSVTVFVWYPQSKNVGHSSLQVDSIYMSFWPAGTAGARDVLLKHDHQRKTLAAHQPYYATYPEDIDEEGGRHPDVRLSVPKLDAAVMIQAWHSVRAAGWRYNLVKRNCSTFVAHLLAIGASRRLDYTPCVDMADVPADRWAERSATRIMPRQMRAMWTPRAVERLARSMGGV